MSYRNYYRVVISNDFLGVSKEISAPNRYELERKVENQKRIWREKMSQYESIIKNICKKVLMDIMAHY